MSLVRIDDTDNEWRRDHDDGSDSDEVFYAPEEGDDDDSSELSSLAGSGSEESVDGENYFYADDPEIKPDSSIFKRAVLVAITAGCFVLVLVCISLVLLLVPEKNNNSSSTEPIVEGPYIHDLKVEIKDRQCSYKTINPPGCTSDVNDLIGCQIGCGLEKLECGLNVTVSWEDIAITQDQQWIYLFATVDAEHWWQTGFAQPLLTSDPTANTTSGQAVIRDGCFGAPYQVVTVVACLSTETIKKGDEFHWFPKNSCNATYGICIPTNDVALLPSSECDGEEWIGNDFVETWDAPYWSAASSLRPAWGLLPLLTLLSFVCGWDALRQFSCARMDSANGWC